LNLRYVFEGETLLHQKAINLNLAQLI
jgi:hypothetical protein